MSNLKLKQTALLFLFLFSFLNKGHSQAYNADTDLKILSWNIHMLPYFVYHKTKKFKRAPQIVDEINKTDFNIVVFQEAFHQRIRKRIRNGLKKKYPFIYGPSNFKFLSLKANSGIWILSDRPLVYVDEIKYNEARGDGKLARKGALMLEGEHNGHLFQVVGTHNNGGWINNSQFLQIRSQLLDPYRKEGVPQLICGDFNTKKSSANKQWEAMIRLFDADLSYHQTDERNAEHKAHWPVEDLYHRWPDFIFIRKNNCKNLVVNELATISIGPVWSQGPKKVYLETVGLSDHYPVMIRLNWED